MTFDRFAVLAVLLLLTATSAQAGSLEPLETALTKAAPDANPKVIALAVHAAQCRHAVVSRTRRSRAKQRREHGQTVLQSKPEYGVKLGVV